MSVAIHDALQDVDLQVGQTYRVEVKGRWVELRVLAHRPPLSAAGAPMLDPWIEFPPPAPQFRLRAKTGLLALRPGQFPVGRTRCNRVACPEPRNPTGVRYRPDAGRASISFRALTTSASRSSSERYCL